MKGELKVQLCVENVLCLLVSWKPTDSLGVTIVVASAVVGVGTVVVGPVAANAEPMNQIRPRNMNRV